MKPEIREKSPPRFYCPVDLQDDIEFQLPDAVAHHAIKVLRLTPGMMITLFNGNGTESKAKIKVIGKQTVIVATEKINVIDRESNLKVNLVQSISSNDKMDLILQKAVELGVNNIQPVETQRSIIRLSPERMQKRQHHWQQVVIAACEQCGRNYVPQVLNVVPLISWLGQAANSDTKFILSPHTEIALSSLQKPAGNIYLLAGPEGGFTLDEEAAAKHSGFVAIRLGKRILRTETAALAALAAMQVKWGDF